MEKFTIAKFETCTREPILRRMKDGTLVCLFLTGGVTEPLNENVVKIARSSDDGATWSQPEVLFSHPYRGCWSTEIFTDCDRPFAAVHTYNAPCHYRELETFVSYPDDSGAHWSEPVSFKGHIGGCSLRQGIRLSNGELLFPLYWQEVQKGFSWMPALPENKDTIWRFVTGAGISRDGEHFERFGYITCGTDLWEPNAFELENGHIFMYCRCNKGALMLTESFDYGRTWTEPHLTDIENPDSKVSLLKIGDTIVMANNFSTRATGGRIHLCLAVSTDGRNFEPTIELEEPSRSFFYPHMYADSEQKILYVAYENTREHKLAKIPFDELGL